MQGVFVNRPALPRYKLIWDVSVVIKYLKSLGENAQLPTRSDYENNHAACPCYWTALPDHTGLEH